MNTTYRLQVELLSPTTTTTSIASSRTQSASSATEDEQQQQQQQQCDNEEGPLHDFHFCSSSIGFGLGLNETGEPFDLYVQSMHLYQETSFGGNGDGDDDDDDGVDVDVDSEGLQVGKQSQSCGAPATDTMEHSRTVYECPPLPLIAITIPVHILQYIDDPNANCNDNDNAGTETNSSSTLSLMTVLSSTLSKIHPSLTYLEPWGLLRSLPQSQLQTKTKTQAQTQTPAQVKAQAHESGGNNTFTVLLLKLNHFDFNDNNAYNTTTDNNTIIHKEMIRILEEVNGEAMEFSPTSVIQALPISKILFACDTTSMSTHKTIRTTGHYTEKDDKGYDNDNQGNALFERNSSSNDNGQDIRNLDASKTAATISNTTASASVSASLTTKSNTNDEKNNIGQALLSEIPLCPVCRFRIEPRRLGLELPKPYQRCSHNNNNNNNNGSNNNNNNSDNRNHDDCCKNMQFLDPWTYPDYCKACDILQGRLSKSGAKPFLERSDSAHHSTCNRKIMASIGNRNITNYDNGNSNDINNNNTTLNCYECGMEETLWVCLSCGVVGCGRYTHGHAEQHYMETSHPFSLELATQRIWDYATSSFVNRDDLLNCKYMQQILGAMNRAAYQGASSSSSSSTSMYEYCDSGTVVNRGGYSNPPFYWDDGSTPKKAVMVGEEYEALLQSALEDQAQHFDLEIAHLQARLASETLDKKRISAAEMREVEELQEEIAKLHTEVDLLSREYVEIQAEEVGHRAKSNSLLREQGVSKQLLDKIREEADREHQEGKLMVEELEQQISDLTANIKMRKQFAGHEELNNAQIYGTSGKQKASRKKGFRRSRR
mmetsp:Transcript_22238/g.33292  ORF Transcript_22238/g.33292 Transcript_22238/m.33292 type:complete len:827 (+) Transcript_22238:45-2525(+)